MPPPEKPLPRPKPKPPKPKPPNPVRVQSSHGGVPFPPDAFACATECSELCAHYRLCPPPPSSHAATVHLRSSRLPTPLIALSASVLAVSVVLVVVLLVCRVVRRRMQRRRQITQQETPLAHLVDEEGAPVPAVASEEGGDGGGVHHVWYIRTVGLDERAIAAITALVYDAGKCRGGAGDDEDGSCAVCLAEFRDGETLRLLPRCRHAFHRGCIDTWLRAHVNCPLCRAPVQVASTNAVCGAATAAPGGEPAASLGVAGGASTVEADRDGALPERAVRRAASMVALPRLAWPDVSPRGPASSSGREGEMGQVKITRLLKLSEALEMAGMGVGTSVSFGAGRAASCQHFPGRSGPSATGTNTDEVSR